MLELANESDNLEDSTLRYIFKQVVTILNKLHKAGIAHRDIKLCNIMVTENCEIKLIDLGYAIPLEGSSGSSYLKTRLGSPVYMAPEIIEKRS